MAYSLFHSYPYSVTRTHSTDTLHCYSIIRVSVCIKTGNGNESHVQSGANDLTPQVITSQTHICTYGVHTWRMDACIPAYEGEKPRAMAGRRVTCLVVRSVINGQSCISRRLALRPKHRWRSCSRGGPGPGPAGFSPAGNGQSASRGQRASAVGPPRTGRYMDSMQSSGHLRWAKASQISGWYPYFAGSRRVQQPALSSVQLSLRFCPAASSLYLLFPSGPS